MTKRPLIIILVFSAIVALGGCVMSGGEQTSSAKGPDQIVFPLPPDEPRYYFERSIHSSAEVKPESEGDVFKRALTGERTKGEGMTKPYGIAVHHGRMFVGDTIRHDVGVYDFPEQKFFKIGVEEDEEGHGKIEMPMGLDVDNQGNLYVFDGKLKQILVFDWNGKYQRAIGDPDKIARPAGIGVTPDGSRIYAIDIGGSSSNEHKVMVFDGKSGEHLFDIGKRGTEIGEFNLPRDAAIAPDGSVYIVDSGNFRVQKFTADGKFISTFGAIGRQSGQFSRPKEAAVDKDGNVYVVDAAFGNFQIFDSNGGLLLAIGNRSNTDGPAKFALPAGIAVDGDGRIYVVDQYFRKVDIFRPVGLAAEDGYIGKNAIAKSSMDKVSKPTTDKPVPSEPGK
jgi:DNA-binding beta-propeller fold protein YncE